MKNLLFSNDHRPDGLPKSWPYSSQDDLDAMPNRKVDVGCAEQTYRFKSNVVKTSKFNWWDFVPMFLLEEFNPKSKIANCYFLIICILQCIPEISNTNGIPTTLIPLTFIVIIDGIFCAMEDWARHKADKLANSSKTLILAPATTDYEAHFQTHSWSDVKVGDIVKVRNRETVPCDIALIDVAVTVGVSEGVCFVETKSIDGETNLKSRNTLNFNKDSVTRNKKNILWYNNLRGQIEMEHPNNLVDSFSGVFCQHIHDTHRKSTIPNQLKGTPPHGGKNSTIVAPATATSGEHDEAAVSKENERRSLSPLAPPPSAASMLGAKSPEVSFALKSNGIATDQERFPILLSNVLLRGCVVRNNEWVVGIAVSTGHDSKIMMTSTSSATKHSSVEVATSKVITYIIMFLLSLGLFASIGQIIWNSDKNIDTANIWYLNWPEVDDPKIIALNWVLANFYYLLIHSSIIPVSLYVSMTFARFIQSFFMMNDLDMYNHLKASNPDETGAIIRSMTLNEELGQVSHIFSDKTGTLTSNIMEFRKMSINGVVYGVGITDIGRASWKMQDKEVPQEILEGEKIAKQNAIPHVVFFCNKYNVDLDSETIRQYSSTYDKLDLKDKNNKRIYDAVLHANRMKEFFFCLAVCHDAIREDDGETKGESNVEEAVLEDFNDTPSFQDKVPKKQEFEIVKGNRWKNIKLSASNPDDQALISAAEFFGFTFAKRLPGAEILVLERVNKSIVFKGVNQNSSFMNNKRASIPSPLSSSSSINREDTVRGGQQQQYGNTQGGGGGTSENNKDRNPDKPKTIGQIKDIHSNNTDMKSSTDEEKEEDMYERKVKMLQTIEFSSKRKRMSVIIDTGEKDYTLYCKGAETVIYERMSKSGNEDHMIATTDSQLQTFAHEGLRCLLVTKRQISKEVYHQWAVRYADACSNLEQIDKKKHGKPNLIEELEEEIEKELVLLGITAIEDRLQDGVPQCIESLLNAGINIWVLTGDKEETAINIAIACNLIAAKDEFMRRILINKATCPTMQDACELMKREIALYDEEVASGGSVKPRSLIVDGPSLVMLLHPEFGLSRNSARSMVSLHGFSDKGVQNTKNGGGGLASSSVAPSESGSAKSLFISLSMKCKAVVGCRVSPDQKREVVTLIRTAYPSITTLGIGDGANDVAMIKEVHIGVGIKGEEGVQAVNASDYAISQFRFLKPLVLKHGRFNYIRLTRLICYVFYKNILMTLGIFLFNFFCGFSGQKPFSETGIQLYNLIYTSLPIILFSGYDMDLNLDMVYQYPKIYYIGVRKLYFNYRVVAFTILNAIVDSALCVILGFYTIFNTGGLATANSRADGSSNSAESEEFFGSKGSVGSFWEIGTGIFTAFVIVTNLKIFYFQNKFTWFHVLINILSSMSWFIVFYGISHIIELDYDCYLLFSRVFGDPNLWLYLIVLIYLIIMKDLVILYIKKEFFYSPVDVLQEMQYIGATSASTIKPEQ